MLSFLRWETLGQARRLEKTSLLLLWKGCLATLFRTGSRFWSFPGSCWYSAMTASFVGARTQPKRPSRATRREDAAILVRFIVAT